MTEDEFIKEIECCFPYCDEERAFSLIKQGARISSNAAFMVLHELCRVPASVQVSNDVLAVLLQEWLASFSHPLVGVVLPLALTLIRGEFAAAEDSLSAMRRIAEYRNEFCALSIAYFACDDTLGDVEFLYQNIVTAWSVS